MKTYVSVTTADRREIENQRTRERERETGRERRQSKILCKTRLILLSVCQVGAHLAPDYTEIKSLL